MILTFDAGISVVQWANRTFDWRDDEYRKLTSLKAGFDIRYFEDQMGRPVSTVRGEDGFLGSTFRGRDFWAQTISHGGEVHVYAVTSCDSKFQPSFTIPNASSGSVIVLERDHLADPQFEHASYEYLMGANTYRFFDAIYGAFPGHYKTYAWGATSTCGGDNVGALASLPLNSSSRRGEAPERPEGLDVFRQETAINTFVETAPGTTFFDELEPGRMDLSEFHGIQLGPSTVLWRSVTAEPFSEGRDG